MTKAKTPSLEPRKRFAPGKRRLTAEQFDAVRPHLARLSELRVKAARMAMVEDLPMDGIAKHFGWSSRQTVSDAVSSVFAAWARFEEAQLVSGAVGVLTPPGWEAVTLLAPPALITRWRKEVQNEFGKILAAAHDTQVQAQHPPRKRRSTQVAAAAALGEQPPPKKKPGPRARAG